MISILHVHVQMERDEEALELLAVGLRDANSAETYCGQARQPLSSVVVQSLEVPQLKVYVSFVQRALRRSLGSAAPAGDNGLQNSSKTSANIALLKTLLRVYMRKGERCVYYIGVVSSQDGHILLGWADKNSFGHVL